MQPIFCSYIKQLSSKQPFSKTKISCCCYLKNSFVQFSVEIKLRQCFLKSVFKNVCTDFWFLSFFQNFFLFMLVANQLIPLWFYTKCCKFLKQEHLFINVIFIMFSCESYEYGTTFCHLASECLQKTVYMHLILRKICESNFSAWLLS